MTGRTRCIAVVSALALGVLGLGALTVPAGADDPEAKAVIRNVSNQVVAVAELEQEDGLVEIKVKAFGVPMGFHGFHIHTVGVCDPTAKNAAGDPSPFFTAGPHLNEGGTQAHPNHDGDLPVLMALGEGKTQKQKVRTDRFTLAELLSGDGTAIIIHADPDDYRQTMTGNAGARFACGVIEEDN